MDTAQHKAQLRRYFDGVGFTRWSAIYGTTPLSLVRRSIREGHTRMVGVAASWVSERFRDGQGHTALDAGCGTGTFSLMLAQRGFTLLSADIAPQMVAATAAALDDATLAGRAECRVADIEEISGAYDLVACFDVLIHYPELPFRAMLGHLADRCSDTLVFTYAPYSALLATLHRIGGYFPRSQRRTEIQMIRDTLVESELARHGLKLRRRQRIGHRFYHVTLVEAQRA